MEDNRNILWITVMIVFGLIAYYTLRLTLPSKTPSPAPIVQPLPTPSTAVPPAPTAPPAPAAPESAASAEKWLKLCEKYKTPTAACWWLQQKFSSVNPEKITWSKQNWNGGRYKGWEAHFFFDGNEYEVEFDEQGNWLETEMQKVAESFIPPHVLSAIKRDFPNTEVLHWEIEYTSDNKVYYEAEIHLDHDIDITYDMNGVQYKTNIYED